MKKIMSFGNSGSGKSTLAKEYADKFGLAHLDLDSLAWKNTSPPEKNLPEVFVAPTKIGQKRSP